MSAPLWLVAILLKATAVLAGAIVLAAVLRRASAAVRHLVWSVGLVALFVLPLVSVAVPWRLAIVPVRAIPTPADVTPEPARQAIDRTASRPPVAQQPIRDQSTSTGTVPSGTARFPAVSLLTLLLAIWAAGATYFLARLVFGALVLARVVRRGTVLDTPDWRRPLVEAADRLALPEVPQLLMSDRFPMPFTCGVWRSAIVLPSGAADWDDRRRRTVLVHELAHLSRRDLMLNAVGQVACALYWFHPLVWMAARKLRIESERACDDLVLGVGTRPSEYADHLLQIVCRASRSRTPAVALPMAQRHEFEGRMLAILERVARREPASGRHAAVLALAALSLVIPLAALAPVQTAPTQSSIASPPATTSPASTPSNTSTTSRPKPSPAPSPLPRATRRADTTAVIAALVRALDDSAASVREDAAYALGQLSADGAVNPLTVRLPREPAPKVREMIAWALGQISNHGAVAVLGAAAQRDSSEEVRAMATWALAQISDDAAIPTLVTVLHDRSAEVRGRAAWAIGSITPSHAPRELIDALKDESGDVRVKAAWALGQITDSVAAPALGVALRDASAEVRRAALWALGQIGGDGAEAALLQALQDKDPEVRARAARALAGGHGDPWPWPWPIPIIR
jgi:beta-lactamase regulating signal transducer with metallopeptidase domain/HEAT repeat protein